MNGLVTRLQRRLERLTLAGKLALGFGLLLVLLLGAGSYSLYQLHVLAKEMQRVYEVDFIALMNAKEGELRIAQMGRAVRQLALAPDEERRVAARRQVLEAEKLLENAIATLRSRPLSPPAQQAIVDYERHYSRYQAGVSEAIRLAGDGSYVDFHAEVTH